AIVAMVIFAGASFFFALAESSLFALSKWQVRQLSERRPQIGGRVEKLLAQPQDLLATIVLGNTFSNAAMVGTVLWIALHESWPMILTLGLLLLAVLLAGEVTPKTLAIRAPEFWATRVASPMSLLQWLTRPFRQI